MQGRTLVWRSWRWRTRASVQLAWPWEFFVSFPCARSRWRQSMRAVIVRHMLRYSAVRWQRRIASLHPCQIERTRLMKLSCYHQYWIVGFCWIFFSLFLFFFFFVVVFPRCRFSFSSRRVVRTRLRFSSLCNTSFPWSCDVCVYLPFPFFLLLLLFSSSRRLCVLFFVIFLCASLLLNVSILYEEMRARRTKTIH